MADKNKKSCGGCIHFLQHYIKYGNEYVAVECGRCMCAEATADERKAFNLKTGCKHFQPLKNNN